MEMLIFLQKPASNHDKQCQIKWDCKTLEVFARNHWKWKSGLRYLYGITKNQREGYRFYMAYTDRFQAASF